MAFTSSVSPVKVPTYLVKCCCYNAWERGSISCWSSSGIGSTCVHSQQQHGYPDSISIARIDKRPAYAIDYGFCNRFMTIIRRGRFASTRIATRRTSDFRCCVVWLTVGLSNIITIRCRCDFNSPMGKTRLPAIRACPGRTSDSQMTLPASSVISFLLKNYSRSRASPSWSWNSTSVFATQTNCEAT
jgi:hypothetical protein